MVLPIPGDTIFFAALRALGRDSGMAVSKITFVLPEKKRTKGDKFIEMNLEL